MAKIETTKAAMVTPEASRTAVFPARHEGSQTTNRDVLVGQPRLQSPSDLDRAGQLYAQGLSGLRIAAELVCAADVVYRRLRRDGIVMRSRGPPVLPADSTELVHLRDTELSWKKVGEAVRRPR